MVAIRHTCCIFKEPRQPIKKHHINGKTTDNIWNNLAVLCRKAADKRGASSNVVQKPSLLRSAAVMSCCS